MQHLKVDKIIKIDLLSLIFIEVEAEATEIIPTMTEVMKEAEEILDQGHIIEREEGIILSEADPDATVIKKGLTEEKANMQTEVTVDNKCSKANPDHQQEDMDLYQGLPVEINTDFSVADGWMILPKIILRRISFQKKSSTEKKD